MIDKTPDPGMMQAFIDQHSQLTNPLFQDQDEEPIEITIGPLEGEEVFSMESIAEEAPSFDANLANFVDEDVLTTIASDLLDAFNEDKMARQDWERTYLDGLKLLGLKVEKRSEPWANACGVHHPILTEAAMRFQSEMIAETFPAQGPVRARIIGKEDLETTAAAARVVADMNYQLTEVMSEFRPEHERMLWNLALAGAAFKKVYFDPTLNRPTSVFIPAEDLYIPYGASSVNTAERVTHQMRKTENEIKKLQYQGFYRDVDLGTPAQQFDELKSKKDEGDGFSGVFDERFVLLEMQVELDLPGFEDRDEPSGVESASMELAEGEPADQEEGEPTGIALPYVVTIEKSTQTVLAIRRNWEEHDAFKLPRQHIVQYTYIPGFGAYGMGLIHLLGGFAESATSILRQLVDAGTLANLPGGLKTNGLRIKGGDMPVMPGEWRDVDVPSGTVRDNVMPLPYKEPSATLFQLLQNVVDEGRRLAATADVKIDGMSSEAPVGTMLAVLERSLKVMSAIQARTHNSMKQEFRLIAALIRDYTAPEYTYDPDDKTTPSAKKADYEQTDIIPVSDPNAATMAQRIIQYQSAVQLSQQAPQVYNLAELHRQMLEVMGIKNADKIIQTDDDLVPSDPVSENMQVLKGKPVKAFIEQDHEAHIQVHQAFMQDPLVAQMMGQNPQAQAILQAGQAHLAEHIGFAYRRKIELQLGVALPDSEEQLSPEIERQMAPLLAQAALQVAQANKAQADQIQAAQQAQDPVFQQQQRELQLKQQELQAKVQVEMAKIEADKEIADKGNQVKLELAGIKERSSGFQTGFKAMQEHLRSEADQAHQNNTLNQTHAHKTAASDQERTHAASEKDKERGFNLLHGAIQNAQNAQNAQNKAQKPQ